MKKAPSAKQVIKRAEKLIGVITSGSSREVVTAAIGLKNMIDRFWNHTNLFLSLAKVDEIYSLKREGAKIARKHLVLIVENWEGSGHSVNKLLFELRTSRIEINDDNQPEGD